MDKNVILICNEETETNVVKDADYTCFLKSFVEIHADEKSNMTLYRPNIGKMWSSLLTGQPNKNIRR